MVATFNPSNRGVVEALRLAVLAAGGIPSMTPYPANYRGMIEAVNDLQAAIMAAQSVALAGHLGAVDPHPQYATDADLVTHTGNTNNPHVTTAAQVGAATTGALTTHTSNTNNPHGVTAVQAGALAIASNLSDLNNAATARGNLGLGNAATRAVGTTSGTVAAGDDARFVDNRTPADGSVTDAKVALGAAIAWGKVSKNGAAAADIGAVATNDARLTDMRTPADGSVTNAKVAAGAAIAWSKLDKTGAVAGDVNAATVTQGNNADAHSAATQAHGLPSGTAVMGSSNGTGQWSQTGQATASGALGTLALAQYREVTVTFAKAFTSAPKVFCTSVSGYPAAVTVVSATGCTIRVYGELALSSTTVVNYLAIGA